MDSETALKEFISSLRALVPSLTARADEIHAERGFELDDGAYSIWLGAYADATNELLSKGIENNVKSVFEFMSQHCDPKNKLVYEHIDVGYVEDLFYRVNEEGRKIGWRILPANLKELYIGFHGRPPL